MAMVDTDWSIDRQTGNIRYIGAAHGNPSPAPSYATVIEFHRWLQDFADDAVSTGDDELDITDATPSERATDNIISLINGYNIDQTAAEHLYDGSISQAGGNDVWVGLVVVGSVPDGTVLQIVKNNTFEDSATAPYWGATTSGVALNGDANANIITRLCIQTRSGGTDIDGQRLRVQSRELGSTFAEFSLTAGFGNNTAAIFTAQDLNNQTAEGTIAALSITKAEGYVLLDADNIGGTEPYYVEWSLNGDSINDLYEYTKWIQSRDATQASPAQTQIFGIDGMLFRGVTHEVDTSGGSGTWTQNETVSWGSGATAGTGVLLAFDNATVSASTSIWIQLLTGVAPNANTITGDGGGSSSTTAGTVVSRTVSPEFIGQSTGAALIGAYGIGVTTTDLSQNDLLRDLNNVTHQPPNNVTFTVGGLIAGEDRVLVAPEDGAGGLDYDQMTLGTSLTTDNITSVVVAASPGIPSDTPGTGTIRVQDNDGVYRRLVYTSYTGTTFTIDPTASEAAVPNVADFATTNASATNNVFISYIDKLAAGSGTVEESFTAVFDTARTLFIRVRDGGGTPIKTFETTGTLGSGGGSSTAIRTSDA
jgi:hypothetical protein